LRKLIVLTALLALLAVPGLASGKPEHENGGRQAVAACKAERDADKAAFKAKYANKNGKHAFKRCVKQHVRQARQTCRAERDADKAAFKTKYGNEKGKHAFSRCVRQHAGDPVT
jgi:hypothetical protein